MTHNFGNIYASTSPRRGNTNLVNLHSMSNKKYFSKVNAICALGAILLATLSGCVGYVDGGYSGGGVVVAEPDVFLFGGGSYDRERDVHDYSHRGAVSRGAAHPSGVGHANGGRHGGKR
jgi:hypothetical protein